MIKQKKYEKAQNFNQIKIKSQIKQIFKYLGLTETRL